MGLISDFFNGLFGDPSDSKVKEDAAFVKFVSAVAAFLLAAIVALGIIFFPRYFPDIDHQMNNSACENEQHVSKKNIYGIITSTFLDSTARNHRRIQYFDGKQIMGSDLFHWDRTNFFFYIIKGDTIHKPPGTLQIHLKNKKRDTVYTLDFGCDPDF